MQRKYDPFLDGTVTHLKEYGVTWIQVTKRDLYTTGEEGPIYDTWLLIHDRTTRLLASIDGPEPNRFLYVVDVEKGDRRKYLTIDGAQEYAVGVARGIMLQEKPQAVPAELKESENADVNATKSA